MNFRDEDFGKSLLTSILTADGLILSLSWGLFKWNWPEDIKKIMLTHLKIGSLFLALSLFIGILCFQFMVSLSQHSEHQNNSVMKTNHVAISFFLCWLTFFAGIISYVIGIWRV